MRSTDNNERRNKRGDSTILDNCIILDSSAIFHIRDPSTIMMLGEKIYVTNIVLEELRDPRAIAIIDILRPEKIEIDRKDIEEVIRKYRELSPADASIIVCAEGLKKRCRKVTVITDDIKLSKILRRIGIDVISIYYPPHKNVKKRS
ncbi:MAG: PIN domain nuclease [Crenarchaeota archaeon]|nr:PIN domain nuclease [Thermoproteota archaeon]